MTQCWELNFQMHAFKVLHWHYGDLWYDCIFRNYPADPDNVSMPKTHLYFNHAYLSAVYISCIYGPYVKCRSIHINKDNVRCVSTTHGFEITFELKKYSTAQADIGGCLYFIATVWGQFILPLKPDFYYTTGLVPYRDNALVKLMEWAVFRYLQVCELPSRL